MKMNKWSSQWTQFMQLRKEEKTIFTEFFSGFSTQLHKLRSLRRSLNVQCICMYVYQCISICICMYINVYQYTYAYVYNVYQYTVWKWTNFVHFHTVYCLISCPSLMLRKWSMHTGILSWSNATKFSSNKIIRSYHNYRCIDHSYKGIDVFSIY